MLGTECFVIEKALRARMNIPVFHDDQHGTAICVSAAVYNALRVVGKDIAKVRVVCSGAGAAAGLGVKYCGSEAEAKGSPIGRRGGGVECELVKTSPHHIG